jgi:outer membrane protein W
MLLWPFKHVGLQASYAVGSFTIAEGRLLARYPFSSGITPYLGAGYLNVTTERSVEVIGIKTRFQDSGVSGVIGVEVPLGKRIFGSIELSGASIDLKKEVISGGITGTASVKYAPITIGISIVYFLF